MHGGGSGGSGGSTTERRRNAACRHRSTIFDGSGGVLGLLRRGRSCGIVVAGRVTGGLGLGSANTEDVCEDFGGLRQV